MPKRLLALTALLAACGSGKTLPVQPQISVDPSGCYFGTDLCLGTWIGTAPINSFQIISGGQQPLTVQSLTLNAPGVFAMQGPVCLGCAPDGGGTSGTPMTLQSGQAAFVQVTFTPTDAQKYLGTITITSNAANNPSLVVPLRGVGVPPASDAGAGGNLPDAGITFDCTSDAG